MEEAKFSFNVKFNLDGFDCQLTVRSDTTSTECIDLGTRAINVLKHHGAVPDRRWEAIKNGENKTLPGVEPIFPDDVPVCTECGKSDDMELVKWVDKGTGKKRAEWKCQRCLKWASKSKK